MGTIDELRALIGAVRRRWFALVALRTAGAACALAAVPIALAAIAGWILAPEGGALVALGVLAGVSALAVCGFVIWRMPRRPSDVTTARFIEEQVADLHLGRLDDTLVSAVQVADARRPGRDAFAQAVVSQAAIRLREIPPGSIVSGTVLRQSAVRAAAGTGCLTLAIVAALPTLGGAADAAWLALFPHSIQISVDPGHARIVGGQPLRIRASLRGRGANLRGVAPSLIVSANGQERTVPMTSAGDAYEFAFESVDRSFTYKVVAASVASDAYSVTAIFPPRVRRIDVRYDYPSFSGLRPRTDEDAGDVYGPAGTKVHISIHTDKPIASGQLAFANGGPLALRSAGERVVGTSLTLSKDDSYRVRLSDKDGLHSTGDTEYFIRLMDDRPPEVRILRPSADQSITPLEEVSIEARADDDYGISRFELVYSVAGREARTVPFASVTGTNIARVGTYLLLAEDLRVQPGDVVTYYARAVDIGRGKRPTETRSDIFFLEVKPFGEEFVAAQSQAMGGAGGGSQQLESLIAAQKEIITATWNLERRSGTGRSVEDAKAVAQAQAELRARAERLASPARRFQSPFMPQQLGPSQQPRRTRTTGDPIAAALNAMGRAVEQLEGQKLREALPHEMAALQGLLQAQAEIRRRQVQQSASGAGQGGTSRMGQDLSALFDRELQRQQRTNYESRSQIEERPDEGPDSSALDRIRDLARRQEDLSRRQRELSEAGLSEEELKRRLETLTREQEALRAEAEALDKELSLEGSKNLKGSKSSEASKSSEGSKGSGSGRGSEGIRGASEQMRQAAGDLKRQDARAAAERAREAAEALRQVEQRLRGNSADARQRAAGELQLEAQQVADAQRRIATEAGRIPSGASAATSDAMRRLAGEKEKLAERVEDLQRSAERLGAQAGAAASTDPAGRAREAAAVLEREQVGRRMRESAKQMRDAAGGRGAVEGQARVEQEIARAVDRAAAALGARTGEAQQLAEQLEQTRAMRERLNSLEQRLRDAEARERASSGGRQAGQGRPGDQGRQGREGRQGSGGSGQGGELQRLRDEYARELQRTRQTLGRMQGEQRSGQNMATPETHEFSRSAPGTEAFKQDYSGWETLRRDIDLAMERYEASISKRIARDAAADRLNAGGSDRVPDAYRRSIARYYESLAKLKE
jgi:hypothetical protein